MNVRFPFAMLLSAATLSLVLTVGCGQPDQTDGDQGAAQTDSGDAVTEMVDPHDVPITDEQKAQLREEVAKFADAVAEIKKFRDTIQEETKDGIPENPFDAHQALDRADLIVQWLPDIARDSEVPKENWETVTTAANEIRALLDKVHQNIDDKVDPDFAAVEQQMAEKIAALEAIAQ